MLLLLLLLLRSESTLFRPRSSSPRSKYRRVRSVRCGCAATGVEATTRRERRGRDRRRRRRCRRPTHWSRQSCRPRPESRKERQRQMLTTRWKMRRRSYWSVRSRNGHLVVNTRHTHILEEDVRGWKEGSRVTGEELRTRAAQTARERSHRSRRELAGVLAKAGIGGSRLHGEEGGRPVWLTGRQPVDLVSNLGSCGKVWWKESEKSPSQSPSSSSSFDPSRVQKVRKSFALTAYPINGPQCPRHVRRDPFRKVVVPLDPRLDPFPASGSTPRERELGTLRRERGLNLVRHGERGGRYSGSGLGCER